MWSKKYVLTLFVLMSVASLCLGFGVYEILQPEVMPERVAGSFGVALLYTLALLVLLTNEIIKSKKMTPK